MIQEAVVGHIDEELAASSIWRSCVSHGEGAWFVGNFGCEFIWDVAFRSTGHLNTGHDVLKLGAACWSTCASPGAFWVFGIGASKLIHESWDHTVEVNSIINPLVCEVD